MGKTKNKVYGRSLEMFPLIELYEESGMTQHKFCEEMDIAHHRFVYWLSKYRQSNKKEVLSERETKSFISLEVEESTEKKCYLRYVRISLPDGALIEYPIL